MLQKHFMCQNESGESYKNILTPKLYSFIIFDIFNVSFGLDDVHIYAFSRRFYPKRFTEHLGYIYIIFFFVCVFLGNLNPQPFALQMQRSTTEPQEHVCKKHLTGCIK